VLLDLNRAALRARDAKAVNQSLYELDKLVTEVFLGYCPHYYLAYAECLFAAGDGNQREFAADLIRKARRLGEESKNPWVAQAADNLERLEEQRKC
jgi:hypothetical protein